MSAPDYRRLPVRADLAAEHLRGRIEAPRYAPARRMRLGDEYADLLAAPDAAAPRETQALLGEDLDVYELAGDWAWAQLAADKYVGYLRAGALRERSAPATHRVAATRTFVYESASIKSRVVAALPMLAAIVGAREAGAFIETTDNVFIYAPHVVGVDAVEEDFVAVAERFLNAPYLWGGKTWLGVDCSGLVQIALARCGVAAPRDTDMQAAELGVASDPGAPLRRGDLVFWKGHVGLMQDNERLLHANGHHMAVASEPLAQARARIARDGAGEIKAVRRLA